MKGQQDIQNKSTLAQIKQAEAAAKLQHEQQMQALKQQGEQQDLKHNAVLGTIQQHNDVAQGLLKLMQAHTNTLQQLKVGQAEHVQDLIHTQQKHNQTLSLAAQKARQDTKVK
jgi:endo-1,4-beta-D-glucanase Y